MQEPLNEEFSHVYPRAKRILSEGLVFSRKRKGLFAFHFIGKIEVLQSS
jgi:hypothetical protein